MINASTSQTQRMCGRTCAYMEHTHPRTGTERERSKQNLAQNVSHTASIWNLPVSHAKFINIV